MKKELSIGDRVIHPLFGKGEVIEGDVPKDHLLVHFFRQTLDCPDGFHRIMVPIELKRDRSRRKIS